MRAVYDLSATPFFLRGSGYPEGTLFPWVVSDFSLIDAIEAGIVKVPRVPVADNSMTGEQPTYRDLWYRIREHLPKKGRGTEALAGEPKLPAELEGALESLYNNYKQYFKLWEDNTEARLRGQTPPVFIVVCNNTNVSKLVFDYISGWEKTLADGSAVLVPGKLGLFSNIEDGRWLPRPNTILVDSEQLESGEAMSDEFRKIARTEIEEFKEEYRTRFPERDVSKISEEDLLREVMNTVGKPGKLGEQIKCVVSVSMLTEGWDANTVTHILGIRAFGTQLLCEQVVGRGLRRTSWALNSEGHFEPEYAEVYGVPFSFIPTSGSAKPTPPKPVTRVRALEERSALEMRFPRLQGYRYDLPPERLAAKFTKDSRFVLSTADVPTETYNAPIVGESSTHTLADLQKRREQEVDFRVAQCLLENFFRDDQGNLKQWLFPQLLADHEAVAEGMPHAEGRHVPADAALDSVRVGSGEPDLPVDRRCDRWREGSEADLISIRYRGQHPLRRFRHQPRRVRYARRPLPHLPRRRRHGLVGAEDGADPREHGPGGKLLQEPQRRIHDSLHLNGQERNYVPDFVVKLRTAAGEVNLIIEVTGEKRTDKEAKVATARTLWVPAVNNHGGFGRWAFVEIADPWDAKSPILAAANATAVVEVA